jgi:hypothetical protein
VCACSDNYSGDVCEVAPACCSAACEYDVCTSFPYFCGGCGGLEFCDEKFPGSDAALDDFPGCDRSC